MRARITRFKMKPDGVAEPELFDIFADWRN